MNGGFEELAMQCHALGQRQRWADFDIGPTYSDFNAFGNREGIFQIHTKIADSAVHFYVTLQELNRSQAVGFLP